MMVYQKKGAQIYGASAPHQRAIASGVLAGSENLKKKMLGKSLKEQICRLISIVGCQSAIRLPPRGPKCRQDAVEFLSECRWGACGMPSYRTDQEMMCFLCSPYGSAIDCPAEQTTVQISEFVRLSRRGRS